MQLLLLSLFIAFAEGRALVSGLQTTHIAAGVSNAEDNHDRIGDRSAALGHFVASGLGLGARRKALTRSEHPGASKEFASPAAHSVGTSWNSTILADDTCWDQWVDYWSNIALVATQTNSGCAPDATSTVTEYHTAKSISASVVTFTRSTEYITNGLFTVSTVLPSESLGTQTMPSQDAETYTQIQTNTYVSCVYSPDVATITQPPCTLPSVVPQCQQSWVDYISFGFSRWEMIRQGCTGNGSKCSASATALASPDEDYFSSSRSMSPICSQASIGTSMCFDLQSSYVRRYGTVEPIPGVSFNTPVVMSHGYQASLVYDSNGSWLSRDWIWNTTWSLAPKCSLGCARCAVTGGTVQVLYWPTMTATTPITMKTMNTTLTYPTLYVYFKSVYASDSCSAIGPTIRNTIIPITDTAEISSRYVTLMDRGYGGHMPFPDVRLITEQFNVSELIPPVPYSVYSKQNWCQTWIWEKENEAAWHSDTTTSPVCPRGRDYNPVIFLPSDILQSLDPLWATCTGDLRGNYDPPTALQPATNIAKPSTLAPIATTPAAPPSQLTSPTPLPTATRTAPVTTSSVTPQQPDTSSSVALSSSLDPWSADPGHESSAPAEAVQTFTVVSESPQASISAVSSGDPSGAQPPHDPQAAASSNSEVPELSSVVDPGSQTGASASSLQASDPATTLVPSQGTAPPQPVVTMLSVTGQIGSSVEIWTEPTQAITTADPDPYRSTQSANSGPVQTLASMIGELVSSLRPSSQSTNTLNPAPLSSEVVLSSQLGLQGSASDPAGQQATDPSNRPVFTSVTGISFSALPSAGSVLLMDSGTTIAVETGETIALNEHTFSAIGTNVVVIDSAPTRSTAPNAPSQEYPEVSASITASMVTIAVSGNGVMVDGAATHTTPEGGQMTNIAGIDISPGSNSDAIVVSSGFTQTIAQGSAATIGAPSTEQSTSLLVAAAQSGAIVVGQGDNTTTLDVGEMATFPGHTVSVPQSGSLVEVDGHTVIVSSVKATLPPIAGDLDIQESSDVIVADANGSTATLSQGEQTTFAGHSLSIASSTGGVLVLDGQTTTFNQPPAKPSLSTSPSFVSSNAPGSSSPAASATSSSSGARTVLDRSSAFTWLALLLVMGPIYADL